MIIDDGGHANFQIRNSFDVLFHKALNPGGLYFIEDLHVGRIHGPDDNVIADMIKSWIDQLLIPDIYTLEESKRGYVAKSAALMRSKYPIPSTIKWIFCQFEACVIMKCDNDLPCKPTYYK